MGLQQKHIFIYGHIQRSFFRECAKREAVELNITGWIRNLRAGLNTARHNFPLLPFIVYGRVECVAQGKEENLHRFAMWCKLGPSWAEVEKTVVKDEKVTEVFKKFEKKATI